MWVFPSYVLRSSTNFYKRVWAVNFKQCFPQMWPNPDTEFWRKCVQPLLFSTALIYIFLRSETVPITKTQHSSLMAPNKSNPSRCLFHTHTCLPQACPGHTRALDNSHACFHKPTPSSSPTSNSHASLDPPSLSPLSESKSQADRQLGL